MTDKDIESARRRLVNVLLAEERASAIEAMRLELEQEQADFEDWLNQKDDM